MNSQFDFDTLAREFVQDIQRWLSSEPPVRAFKGVTETVAAERDRAAESVAERYRERTGALLETLVERRDASGEDHPGAAELARRVRTIEQTRGLSAASAQPVVRPVDLPTPQSVVDALRKVRQARSRPGDGGSSELAGSGKPAAPQKKQPPSGQKKPEGKKMEGKKPAHPVREIPGVGSTLESRLKKAGVTDAEGVADLPPQQLADVLQVSPKRAEHFAELARILKNKKT
jgi:nucleotidyltransferase/DNA polymerase involved in DNA repair